MSSVSLTTDDIVRVTQELWGTMLNIDLVPANEPAPAPNGIVACVHIMGAWAGCVRLDLPDRLAYEATAAFLGVSSEEVLPEQARDTAGELANMTAGSIKPLVPRPSKISLPTIAEGRNLTFQVKHGHQLLQTVFDRNGDKYVVTVITGEGE